jgi:hypothetical protein
MSFPHQQIDAVAVELKWLALCNPANSKNVSGSVELPGPAVYVFLTELFDENPNWL